MPLNFNMTIPKKYFHDKLILLLLSATAFMTVLSSLLILLRLDGSREGYIIEYRSNLGLNAFRSGGTIEILSFIVFVLLIAVTHVIISIRIFKQRRDMSVTVLGMGVFLQLLATIVSNALLVLR